MSKFVIAAPPYITSATGQHGGMDLYRESSDTFRLGRGPLSSSLPPLGGDRYGSGSAR